jgi:hypothetical protein
LAANGSAAYRFNLTDRQNLFFNVQQGTGIWDIYQSNGQSLSSLSQDLNLWLNALVMQKSLKQLIEGGARQEG